MKESQNPIKVYEKGDKSTQSIIFIHGFPYDYSLWDAQIEYFSKKFHCLAYDVRGLGSSVDAEGQFTMEMYVDDLEELIESHKVQNPILCGMSMGGYIALRAMERFGEKLAGAILADTVSLADTDEAKLKRSNAIKTIKTKGLSAFVDDFIPNCYGDDYKSQYPEKLQERIDKSAKYDSKGVIGALLAMISRIDTTKAVEKFHKPLLFICGKEDTLTPPEKMQELAEHAHNAKFMLIENAAHMSMVENPKHFNGAMEAFLSQNFSHTLV